MYEAEFLTTQVAGKTTLATKLTELKTDDKLLSRKAYYPVWEGEANLQNMKG